MSGLKFDDRQRIAPSCSATCGCRSSMLTHRDFVEREARIAALMPDRAQGDALRRIAENVGLVIPTADDVARHGGELRNLEVIVPVLQASGGGTRWDTNTDPDQIIADIQQAIARAGGPQGLVDIEFPHLLPHGANRSLGRMPKWLTLGEHKVSKRVLLAARGAWFEQHGIRGRRCDRRRWRLRARTIFPMAHDAVLEGRKDRAILILMEVCTATDAAWLVETGRTWGESAAGRGVIARRQETEFFSRELKRAHEHYGIGPSLLAGYDYHQTLVI